MGVGVWIEAYMLHGIMVYLLLEQPMHQLLWNLYAYGVTGISGAFHSKKFTA